MLPDALRDGLIVTVALTILCTLAMLTPRGRRLLSRAIRTGNSLRKDTRIPRAWRWALFIALVLPIPGEFDELLGALILAVMWPRYGHIIRATWAATA